jgi:hypothetical protein
MQLRLTFIMRAAFLILVGLAVGGPGAVQAADQAKPAANLFANPGFEDGREPWRLDQAGKTIARLTLDETAAVGAKDPALGRYCARIAIDTVDQWGVQFGQSVGQLQQGKTYTFAVVGRSVKGPVTVRLEAERSANPWDRAGASEPLTLTSDRWREFHVTFRVAKPFPEGCFAYLSCTQPKAEFRVDSFRLYQGEYVPYEKATQEETRAVAVSLYDTGATASAPLSPDAIARRPGWGKVPEDETQRRFAGDAVLANDRLALVLRRGTAAAELYARGEKGYQFRAGLAPAGAADAKLAAASIVENGPGEVIVDAEFAVDSGRNTVRFSLAMGQAFVRTEARQGAKALAVEAPCRYLVLPDFFADDIVIDAAEIPVASAELPSENFLIQLLPGRQSLLMTVSNAREQDALVHLSGEDRQRQVRRTEIPYGKDGKVWVALLEGERIWYEHEVARTDRGKIVPLDWRTPFAAQWRVDWHQADRLTGSWEMVAQRADGQFEKYGWFGSPQTLPRDRNRWTTVLGTFQYPCWIDQQGQGFLQPLTRGTRFEGPAIVYPINRVKATPLDRFTVVDLVRATLGVGPCEYILDLEGQGTAYRGRATCGTRDALKPIYAAKQQKARRAEIERILGEVVVFVKHIRGRIEEYVAFGREISAYAQAEKKSHPELADFLDEMDRLAKAIQTNYDKRKESIKTPQYVIDLTERFRRELLDYEGDDALARCNQITEAIVVVGGNQDELVGESRMAVKVLRQRAGLAMAVNPATAEIAKEIRRRTQQILRNAASYESPRH